jgi:hypothetical protein
MFSVFIVWDAPQWLHAAFGLVSSEPLVPWLQKNGLPMLTFSPYWITGTIAAR